DTERLKNLTGELTRVNTVLEKSVEKYRSYLDNAPDGVFITNEAGRYIEVNDAACRITGYSKEELLKMSITDILPEESVAEGQDHFRKLVENGTSKSDLLFKHKNGSHRWWTVDAVKLNETRFLGFTKDITYRKEMEETLRQHHSELEMQNEELSAAIYEAKVAKEKYAELYDLAPTGYFTLSTDFKILELNITGARLLGKERSRLIDNHFGHFVSIISLPVFHDFLLKLFKSETKQICEVILEKTGNQPRCVHIEGVVIANGTQCLLNVVDITDRKQAEKELLDSRSSLEEAQRISQMGSWEWDLISGTVTWSKEMYKVFDISPGDFGGKPESAIKSLHPDDVESFIQCMNANISGGISPSLEYRVIHRDGSVHYLLAEGNIQFDENGTPARSVGTVQDITGRKASETIIQEKEKDLRALFDTATEAIFLLDSKGIILDANEELGNRFGLKSDNMIGSEIYSYLSPEVIMQRKPVIESVCKTGKPVRFEDIRSGRHFLNSLYPIFASDGTVNRLAVFGLDITDRVLSERTLKESERLYRTLLNASPDGIFLIDLKGIITEVSEIGVELLGADSRNELVGEDVFRFVPSDEKNAIKEIIEKTTSEGLVQNIGVKIRKKNQTVFAGETSATLIQSPDGAPIAYMIILRDISHRKKMETKQLHADRMANLGEMASGIAHEINQPLNIISMVMDKILFEAAKTTTINIDFLKIKSDKIFENITRIRNIIDHIRAFSRSHDDYVLTDFDINKSIENAASMITEQFKHLGINLVLQLEKQIPQICGNTYKFEQVIINLLTNAKDAVIEKRNKQDESFDMIVGISSYQENQSLIVEVTDNGIGISNEDINNIILPFYTTKDEGKGTGLGLSICYQIIKDMDGTIGITSEKLNGTQIKLILNIQEKK
ncbi:MAG: PAS domain S-box protein, partial [Bacteroidota bacterium]